MVKTRKLLDEKPWSSNIPSLKSPDGTWEFDSKKKASLIATTFQKKYHLLPPEENEYTPLLEADRKQLNQDIPSEKEATNILNNLAADSATGPDALPARMLKECAVQLAAPFRMLAMLILKFSVWPKTWMIHWIVLLFKKRV